MQKLYWAITYFVIGYAIVVVTIVSLYKIPGFLRTSIGMTAAAIVFSDVAYRYFKRTTETSTTVGWKRVLKLMTLWIGLSIGLDTLLLVIIMPLIATGSMNLHFFEQQPVIYWIQFPMYYVIGFVAQSMYNRVVAITSAQLKHLP